MRTVVPRACTTRRSSACQLEVLTLTIVLLALLPISHHRALAQATADTDSLNFALNVEYVQADFYSCASSGRPLSDALRGGGPAPIGCKQANLTENGQAIVAELANNEVSHVRYLRSLVGADAIPVPQLNIGSAFAQAANIALGQTQPPFSPYQNDLSFYQGAFLFEDVGVTFYDGLIGGISNTTVKQAIAAIDAAEGYHGGIIRTMLYENAAAETYANLTVSELIQNFAYLRGKVGAGNGKGVINTTVSPASAIVVAADEKGLGYERDFEQITDILTLGAGKVGGGFFPNGLGGASAANVR